MCHQGANIQTVCACFLSFGRPVVRWSMSFTSAVRGLILRLTVVQRWNKSVFSGRCHIITCVYSVFCSSRWLPFSRSFVFVFHELSFLLCSDTFCHSHILENWIVCAIYVNLPRSSRRGNRTDVSCVLFSNSYHLCVGVCMCVCVQVRPLPDLRTHQLLPQFLSVCLWCRFMTTQEDWIHNFKLFYPTWCPPIRFCCILLMPLLSSESQDWGMSRVHECLIPTTVLCKLAMRSTSPTVKPDPNLLLIKSPVSSSLRQSRY